ncbi:MAM and LDL-receptor class A domain-containing protein 1-like isoform X1 [Biomphalaria glabrata]|uniref:Metalloendopeptidase n=1 Tax=Biomphalaria glabrata TaxID=6526 RepID=A0A9W2ZNL5_BIOGL|nr:MAM and LDL-receptor class A domain-containing protein 1-like isoform X1 [Biomphalaria glabrata]XP_055876553.1 MAM and LDL-receptor class A domain-containing protein 1-like isoform X1 [Biomphalaria glabrata]XP_055876554.1 MAM and LDL-receptor class A domain-containing protein 1-like isoform X1 [Biomphalaria glabrata]
MTMLCWKLYVITLVYYYILLVKSLPLYTPENESALEEYFNPEENLGVNIFLTEGDILIDREEYILRQSKTDRSGRHAVDVHTRQRRSLDLQYYKTWYNRTVPYMFDSNFAPEYQRLVEAAIYQIQNVTCIRFKIRQSEKDYIKFTKPDTGCFSPVGRTGGKQEVSLGEGCLVHGIIQHEILHALGLWHEQSRQDRDEYIKVLWDNIPKEHWPNFEARTLSESHQIFLNLDYDYGSVMHYANNTFAIDRQKPTLIPKRDLPPGVVMGQRLGMSAGDKDKLNALYRCDITNCSEPGRLTNGWIDGGDYLVGSRIFYNCDIGHVLIGASERVCRDLGLWSGETPTCLPTNPFRPLRYCNFDNQTSPLCGWTQANDDELDWTLLSGPTMSEGTGPNLDHTLGTVYGTYVYVEASSRSPGQKARLISPLINTGSSRLCLVFFTFMYGDNMGNLTVYVTQPNRNINSNNEVLTLEGSQGEQWKEVFLHLEKSNSPFTIVFEGSLGNGYKSDIAIDDIILGDCSTFKPLTVQVGLSEAIQCNFDSGLCGFFQDRQDDMDWLLNMGKTSTLETGPDCDPLDCQNGKYLYIESSRPRMMGNKAKLRTPVLGGEGRRCLTFYYHMFGDHIGSLTVRMVNIISGVDHILWAASGNKGNQWFVQQVDYSVQEAHEVSFEASVGPGYRGDIAIDSIEIATGRCHELPNFNCSFTEDFCGWVNAPTPGDMLDWTRHRGETDTSDTGPESDRLSPGGYYVYVESSRTIIGDTARLVSPTVSYSPSGYCLQFWYHMYGRTSGNLTVYTQTDIGQETILWSASGNQGNDWRSFNANITNTHGRDFNVIFQATMAGFTGDIAIDDISIQKSLCRLR